MTGSNKDKRSWAETVRAWLHPRVITMLFLGFSAGIPILLIFSTLGIWLTEAGVSRSAVTFFSWAALGYSFKFVWAPLVDRLPLPYLTRRLGRRRGWMFTSQLMVIGAICLMGSIDPSQSHGQLVMIAWAAVLLGFSSATQDIVIDAYRIECAEKELQGMLSASYIAGYRIGMMAAGAGALAVAAHVGTSKELYVHQAWQTAYFAVAFCMLVGVITTLLIPEPERSAQARQIDYTTAEYGRFFLLFLSAVGVFVLTFYYSGPMVARFAELGGRVFPLLGRVIAFLVEVCRLFGALIAALVMARLLVAAGLVDRAMVNDTYIDPVKDFFMRYGLRMAGLLLLLIGFYRVSDIVLGVIAMVFYTDIGFIKEEIAKVVQVFGILMTIAGTFLGGMLIVRYGVLKILFAGAVLSALTNILFMLLALHGPDIWLLKAVIAADNLAAGMAAAAFVAFLSSLTSVSFTAVQYAIFSSLMTLFPKLIGGYSGTIVTSIGYPKFFLLTTLMGVPVLLLIWLVRKVE
jgi:PAT family beta-lactamase induction signal transducer AmpG